MKKVLLVVLVAGVVVAAGVVGWFYLVSGSGEPSGVVTAPPIAGEDPTTDPTGSSFSTGPTGTTGPTAGVFELAEGTIASFELDEELRGTPQHVVATNIEVVGQIRLDHTDLAATRIGTILINARTFETDSANRDRAIRGPILDAEAVEFIEFTPTAVDGLTGPAVVGAPIMFTITGDLKIRDVVQTVTFEAEATLVADDTLEGTATTTVLRSAFDINIPSVPSVANVSDEVLLSLEFVAVQAS